MTDLEISKALTLAIGHQQEDIFVYADRIEVSDHAEVEDRIFDYRDWNVIGPIAARYNCFPVRVCASWNAKLKGNWYVEDTPQKAIALAVIQGAKK